MKNINFIGYKPKTIIEPAWLSMSFLSLMYIIRGTWIFIVITIVFDMCRYGNYQVETNVNIMIMIISGFLIVFPIFIFLSWYKSYCRIYDNGILEVRNYSLVKKNGINLKSFICVDISKISKLDIVYYSIFTFKQLYLKIITDQSVV